MEETVAKGNEQQLQTPDRKKRLLWYEFDGGMMRQWETAGENVLKVR